MWLCLEGSPHRRGASVMHQTRALVVALACALAPAQAGRASDLETSLAALRETVARHPDDPEVSWSLAAALETVGRSAEAADRMQAHLARWPDRPSGGWTALGRCAYRAGRMQDAKQALERALLRNEKDAQAQLYLGLALRALREWQRAETHLEAAAALDPELAGDALLLSGMSRVTRGDAQEGRALLARVIERAPESASARDARAFLENPTSDSRSPFRIEAFAGAHYDSNVTLEGEGDFPGAGPAQDDALFDFGARVAWRPAFGEAHSLEIAAHYDRLDYLELDEYATQRFLGTGAWKLPLHRNASLRLAGSAGYWLLDDDPYLSSGALNPSLLVGLGAGRGLLRVSTGGERLDYEDDPLIDSLERSGWNYGGGVEHLLPFAGEREGWLVWGGSYRRRDTDAHRDPAGYRAAYDHDRWRASLWTTLRFPFEIHARANLALDAERYDHRNVIDALTQAAAGDASPADRRRDLVWSSRVSLRRKLLGDVEVEIDAQFVDRSSNVDLYSYQRTLAGVRLHAALP